VAKTPLCPNGCAPKPKVFQVNSDGLIVQSEYYRRSRDDASREQHHRLQIAPKKEPRALVSGFLRCLWRKCMGIEPTRDGIPRLAPDLKSGSPTSELGTSGVIYNKWGIEVSRGFWPRLCAGASVVSCPSSVATQNLRAGALRASGSVVNCPWSVGICPGARWGRIFPLSSENPPRSPFDRGGRWQVVRSTSAKAVGRISVAAWPWTMDNGLPTTAGH
jgi:hypothetical protein